MSASKSRGIWIGIGLATIISLQACTQPASPPEKTVEALYAPYVSHAAEYGESAWEKAPVYSRNFKSAIDRGFEYSAMLNEPVIDYDPIVNAQDFSISKLRVELDKPAAAGKAHVVARFLNNGSESAVGYDMVMEDGVWKIDGIRSGDEDLRKVIDDALKPIGDSNAMKTPVVRIYSQYAESTKVDPLFRWAPLTNDLRGKLQKASAKSATLDLDAVCGGSACMPSGVTFEAVSGGVIAKFKVDGKDRVAVFDVVENQGAWVIDDIHVPGDPPWDLIQKLEDAGIRN